MSNHLLCFSISGTWKRCWLKLAVETTLCFTAWTPQKKLMASVRTLFKVAHKSQPIMEPWDMAYLPTPWKSKTIKKNDAQFRVIQIPHCVVFWIFKTQSFWVFFSAPTKFIGQPNPSQFTSGKSSHQGVNPMTKVTTKMAQNFPTKVAHPGTQ